MTTIKNGLKIALQNVSTSKPTPNAKQLIRTGGRITIGHSCHDRFDLPQTGVLNSSHPTGVPGAYNLRVTGGITHAIPHDFPALPDTGVLNSTHAPRVPGARNLVSSEAAEFPRTGVLNATSAYDDGKLN